MESVCFAIVITVLKHGVFFKTFFITSRTSDCRKVKFYIRRVKSGARNVLFSVGGVKRFLKVKRKRFCYRRWNRIIPIILYRWIFLVPFIL